VREKFNQTVKFVNVLWPQRHICAVPTKKLNCVVMLSSTRKLTLTLTVSLIMIYTVYTIYIVKGDANVYQLKELVNCRGQDVPIDVGSPSTASTKPHWPIWRVVRGFASKRPTLKISRGGVTQPRQVLPTIPIRTQPLHRLRP
jgi:hypothetical protein